MSSPEYETEVLPDMDDESSDARVAFDQEHARLEALEAEEDELRREEEEAAARNPVAAAYLAGTWEIPEAEWDRRYAELDEDEDVCAVAEREDVRAVLPATAEALPMSPSVPAHRTAAEPPSAPASARARRAAITGSADRQPPRRVAANTTTGLHDPAADALVSLTLRFGVLGLGSAVLCAGALSARPRSAVYAAVAQLVKGGVLRRESLAQLGLEPVQGTRDLVRPGPRWSEWLRDAIARADPASALVTAHAWWQVRGNIVPPTSPPPGQPRTTVHLLGAPHAAAPADAWSGPSLPGARPSAGALVRRAVTTAAVLTRLAEGWRLIAGVGWQYAALIRASTHDPNRYEHRWVDAGYHARRVNAYPEAPRVWGLVPPDDVPLGATARVGQGVVVTDRDALATVLVGDGWTPLAQLTAAVGSARHAAPCAVLGAGDGVQVRRLADAAKGAFGAPAPVLALPIRPGRRWRDVWRALDMALCRLDADTLAARLRPWCVAPPARVDLRPTTYELTLAYVADECEAAMLRARFRNCAQA